jgi:hypothetical protein
VDTSILESERNRPAHLSDKSAPRTGPIAGLGRQWFAEQLKQGLSPRKVGDQVLAAILDERFYILTHPDWNPLIEHRMKTILAGENPNPIRPPGVESLLQKIAAMGGGGAR